MSKYFILWKNAKGEIKDGWYSCNGKSELIKKYRELTSGKGCDKNDIIILTNSEEIKLTQKNIELPCEFEDEPIYDALVEYLEIDFKNNTYINGSLTEDFPTEMSGLYFEDLVDANGPDYILGFIRTNKKNFYDALDEREWVDDKELTNSLIEEALSTCRIEL